MPPLISYLSVTRLSFYRHPAQRMPVIFAILPVVRFPAFVVSYMVKEKGRARVFPPQEYIFWGETAAWWSSPVCFPDQERR